MDLKDRSCVIDRLRNKQEEFKLEKIILLKENERLIHKKEDVENGFMKFKEELAKNVQKKAEQVKELTKVFKELKVDYFNLAEKFKTTESENIKLGSELEMLKNEKIKVFGENKKIDLELKIIKKEKNRAEKDLQDLLKKFERENKKQENSVEFRNFKSQIEKMNLNKGSQTEVKLHETAKKSESMIADKKTVAKNNKKKRRKFFCF